MAVKIAGAVTDNTGLDRPLSRETPEFAGCFAILKT